jgi:predicted porin
MNKKIIAMALAGAFLTPLAMADVTLYGFISAAMEGASASNDNSSATNTYPGRAKISDQNSRIGFKGNEDLGNGTKTIWQVESSLKNFEQGGTNDKGESATFGTRNTFIGLSDSTYGQALMGYYDSAYKRYTNVGANVMADTTADTMGDSGGVLNVVNRGNARLKNSAHYDSPVWNGLQAGVSYGFDEYRTTGTGKDAARISLGASYTNGGLKVGAGYDRINDSTASLSSSTGFKLNNNQTSATSTYVGTHTAYWSLAASYKFVTDTLLAATFERATYTQLNGVSDMTQNDWSIAAVQTFGNAAIKLSYNKLGSLNNATVGNPGDYEAKQWVLGATYNLSKQTQLLAYATQIENNKYQNVNFTVNSLYTTAASGTTSATNLSPGAKLRAIGAGIKYSF